MLRRGPSGFINRLVLLTGVRHKACVWHGNKSGPTRNGLINRLVFLCPALAEHIVFVVFVRNGSQLTGVPWDLRLAGHTSATHTFLVNRGFTERRLPYYKSLINNFL